MDLSKMSRAQLEQLEAQIAEQKKKKAEDVEIYKNLVDEAVEAAFPTLEAHSTSLAKTKGEIFDMFETAKKLKADLFKVKEGGQWSHTFMNAAGTKRITLGTNTLDNYDDTAESGIAMVNEYLDELATGNDNATQAVKICRSLMAKDKKGNLKPSKIILLRKHALESGSQKFIEGVDIIMNAYQPIASKKYIRAEYKNGKGEWVNIPLGMTEAE